MNTHEVNQLIRTRRSVFTQQFIEKEVPETILHEILENANWAPTHRLTEPWRFKVIRGESRKRLGIFLSEKYRSIEPKELFSVAKYEKLKMNPQKADTVIAICLQRDAKNRVPEWEELASVAMAVQNLWLSAHAHGVGGYWSTPELISNFREFHPLAEGETCIGFFYLGYYEPTNIMPPRRPIWEKVKWMN